MLYEFYTYLNIHLTHIVFNLFLELLYLRIRYNKYPICMLYLCFIDDNNDKRFILLVEIGYTDYMASFYSAKYYV